MAFELPLTADFSELFRQLNKLADNLKQIQLVSRAASEQIQNDFKKSATGTAALSDSSNKLLNIFLSLTNALGNFDIGSAISKGAIDFSKLTSGVKLTETEIKTLSQVVLEEASQFTDASDKKQAELQKEVQALKDMQAQAASNTNTEKAKEFTSEISNQIIKVHELTQEVQKTILPVQGNPFEVSEKGVQALRNEILKARTDADNAFKTFGAGSIEVTKANDKVKQLEQSMKALIAASSGVTLPGVSTTAGEEDNIKKKTVATGEFNQAIIESIKNINKQADSVISEASQFTSVEDQKQIALQQEVQKLKELQNQLSAPQGVEQVKITTAEIQKQTSVVKNLTSEIKNAKFDEGGNPFEKATTGAVSLRTQILNARNAAAESLITYGKFSPEFRKASNELARLINIQGDINRTAQAFNPEQRFQGLTNIIQGAVGGFSAVQGAMAFFGDQSEDIARSLQKVQGLLLFSQGINEVLSLGTAFNALLLKLGLTTSAKITDNIATEAEIKAEEEATLALNAKAFATQRAAIANETKATSEGLGVAATKIHAEAQTEDAVATNADALAQFTLARASAFSKAAQAQATIVAEANTAAQLENAAATGAAGGAANIASGFFSRLWAVMLENPLLPLIAVAGAFIGILHLLSSATNDQIKAQTKLNDQEAEQFKFLLEIEKLKTKGARNNIQAAEDELKILEAQGASQSTILQKQLEINSLKLKLSKQSIDDLKLQKDKEDELSKTQQDNLKKLAELRLQLSKSDKPGFFAGVGDVLNSVLSTTAGRTKSLLKDQIAELESATKKTGQILDASEQENKQRDDAKTERSAKIAELNKKILEDELNSEKANIEASIALDKAGSSQKLQDEIALAEAEKKIQVQSLQDQLKIIQQTKIDRAGKTQEEIKREEDQQISSEKSIQSQILLITNQTTQKIIQLKTDAAIQIINNQKALDEANLISIQKGSREELDLKNKIIKESSEAEILNLQLSEKQKSDIEEAIRTDSFEKLTKTEKELAQQVITIRKRSQNEINENTKQFLIKSTNEQIEIEKQFIATRLLIIEKGSQEELRLNKEAIDVQAKQDIEAEKNSTDLEETKEKKIIQIREAANIQKEILQKDFNKNEFDRQQQHAKDMFDAEQNKQAAGLDELPLSLQLQFEKERLDAQADFIREQRVANLKGFSDGLIDIETYNERRKALEKETDENLIAQTKNTFASTKQAIDDLVSFAKSAFPGLGSAASEAFDQLGNSLKQFIDISKKLKDGSITNAQAIKAEFQAIGLAVQASLAVIQSAVDAQIQAQEALLEKQHESFLSQISDLEGLISAKENEIDKENELNEKGLANNLDLKRKELAELKKQKEDALKKDAEIKAKQQELQKKQISIDAITQASQLALAAAQILASFSTIPLGIGIAIAAGVIAGMYAIFEAAKSKSQALTTLESGGDIKIENKDYGKIKGRRHTQGGHNIEGTNLNVEDGEYLSHRRATEKYYKFLTAANKDDFQAIEWKDILNLPGISFPGLQAMNQLEQVRINEKSITRITENKNELRTLEISRAYHFSNQGVEKELREIKAELSSFKKKFVEKPEVTTLPDGRIMVIEGNVTRVIKKND